MKTCYCCKRSFEPAKILVQVCDDCSTGRLNTLIDECLASLAQIKTEEPKLIALTPVNAVITSHYTAH